MPGKGGEAFNPFFEEDDIQEDTEIHSEEYSQKLMPGQDNFNPYPEGPYMDERDRHEMKKAMKH